MPQLALVLVHYRTPELLPGAIEALRRDLGEAADDNEWVVVDNGCDAAGVELLRSLPVTVVEPGRNLGFAGGVNLGVERTSAPVVVVLNPDVLVLPGCLGALTERLAAGAAVAGPRFFWDRGRRLLLPPPERRTRADELWALLADRGPHWARRARRRWRRHARDHWCAAGPLRSIHLSGALLALRRDAFARIGPFDEGYRLYFEETDWLARLERQGLFGEHVPAAAAVHLYARSAARERAATEWFEDSRRRFQRRRYGAWFELLWRALARRRVPGPAAEGADLSLHIGAGEERRWVELGPGSRGFPAAAERIDAASRGWRPPPEVEHRLEPGRYRLQLVAADGRELASRQIVLASEGGGRRAGRDDGGEAGRAATPSAPIQ